MGMLRANLRKLLELRDSRTAAEIRHYLLARQIRRDKGFTRKVASALGEGFLENTQQVFGKRPADTLFILAGGTSVNELTQQHLRHMGRHRSIGINFWPIHSFIPNGLATETDNLAGPPSRSNVFISEKIREPAYRAHLESVITLRPPFPPNPNRLYDLPSKIRKNSFIYGRANLISRSAKNLKTDLARALKATVQTEGRLSVVPDNGSSVVRLTFLALAHGFKEIVWVGVDQNSKGYFWTSRPITTEYQDAAALFPRKESEPHSTSSAENRQFTNDFFLRSLSEAIAETTNSRIYVSSPNSSLSDAIPVYPWPNSSSDELA